MEERERERIEESKMYEGRGAMVKMSTVSSRESYTPVESIHSEQMKEVKLGRDFAMSRGRSLMPEDQVVTRTQTKIRETSESEEKYGPGKIEGERKKKERRMPWEI